MVIVMNPAVVPLCVRFAAGSVCTMVAPPVAAACVVGLVVLSLVGATGLLALRVRRMALRRD